MKISAPLDYVFKWCTDFREDDTRITGSNSKRIVLEKTSKRAIYVALNNKRDQYGNKGGRIYLVKFSPPNIWYLEAHGNGFDTAGRYSLSRISERTTRLRIAFTHTYYEGAVMTTKKEKEMDSRNSWEKYIGALESDFLRSNVVSNR